MQTEKKTQKNRPIERETNVQRDKSRKGGGDEKEEERKHPVKEDDIITEEKNIKIFYRNYVCFNQNFCRWPILSCRSLNVRNNSLK